MSDKIIRFPGVRSTQVGPPEGDKPGRVDDEKQPSAGLFINDKPAIKLTEDQEKAVKLIASGIAFVFIGLKPTDSGADFFTAIHGDHTDLRNAEREFPAVIGRLYQRKGIT